MDKLIPRICALITLTVLVVIIWANYLTNKKYDMLGTATVAPIYVNVESQSRYCGAMRVVANNKLQPLSPTSEPISDNSPVICGAEKDVSERERIKNFALAIKSSQYDEVMKSINNVTVIIGSKPHYFSRAELVSWASVKTGAFTILIAPESVKYIDGFFTHYINYYGDLNFIINGLLSLIANPIPLTIAALILIWMILFQPNRILNNTSAINFISAFFTDRHKIATLITILFAGLLIRLNGYDFHTAWHDEIYYATKYGNPNNNFIYTFMDPCNPPLYHMLLYFWSMFCGWSEGTGRLLSVVIGTLGIATMYLFLRRHTTTGTALLGALLVAISGYSLSFSHEIRSYILVYALVPLVLDALIRFVKAPEIRYAALFLLWGVFLVNTHFFGVFIIFTGFLCGTFWLWQDDKKREALILFGLCILIALSLAPYFYITEITKELIEDSWLKPPDLSAFLYLMDFITGNVAMFFMTLMGVIIAFFFVRKNDLTSSARKILIYSVTCFIITTVVVYVESIAYRPMWLGRYFTILAPLYISIVAICASVRIMQFKNNLGHIMQIALVLCALHFGMPSTHSSWDKSIIYPSLKYIASDIAARKGKLDDAVVFVDEEQSADYYRLVNMTIRKPNDNEIARIISGANTPIIIYAEPRQSSNDNPMNMFYKAGIKYPLQIQVSQDKYIYKAYINRKGKRLQN